MTNDTYTEPPAQLVELVHATLTGRAAAERAEESPLRADEAALPGLIDLYLLNALPEWAEELVEEQLAAEAGARAVLIEHAQRFAAGRREVAWQTLSEMLQLAAWQQMVGSLLLATALRPRYRRVARGEGLEEETVRTIPIVTPDGEPLAETAEVRTPWPIGDAHGRLKASFTVLPLPEPWQTKLAAGAIVLQVRIGEGWVSVPVKVRSEGGPGQETMVVTAKLALERNCREHELNLKGCRLAFVP